MLGYKRYLSTDKLSNFSSFVGVCEALQPAFPAKTDERSTRGDAGYSRIFETGSARVPDGQRKGRRLLIGLNNLKKIELDNAGTLAKFKVA